MNYRAYLRNFIVMVMLVVALYIVAVTIGLFYIFWWFNWVMHLLGGMAIGYFVLAWAAKKASLFSLPKYAIIAGFTIGVLWEIFERVGHLIVPNLLSYGGIFDTTLDTTCGILGALFIVILESKKQT